MAKTNIKFNNKNYEIDEQSLSTATNALKAHLSTTMSGIGATIEFDGVSYSIDSVKLSAAEDVFASYLDTISGETPEEEVLEGTGSEYYTLAPTALSFRSTEPLNEFQEVLVNGEVVDSSNYTLEEGSTIVKLSIDYLKTLNTGNYDVAIVSENKIVNGNFTVKAPTLNEHGFYYNQPYYAYVNYFGSGLAIFIHNNGTLDTIFMDGRTDTCVYTVDGNNMVVTSDSLGELHCTISDNGTEIYLAELDTTFTLGEGTVNADNDYLYVYKEDLDGYEVTAIDKTKSSYGDIKTGVNGYPTVALAQGMFMADAANGIGNTNMTTVPKIPDTVTTIGGGAFYGCESLTSVTIPDSVTSIGREAFGCCRGLISITMGNSVTSIGEYAFVNCMNLSNVYINNMNSWCNIDFANDAANPCQSTGTNNLYLNGVLVTELVIPNNITTISNYAFYNCTSLTSVEIPDSVTCIGDLAFFDCSSLTSVTIPDSVTSIGRLAFENCDSLTSITFNGTTAQWEAISKDYHWNYNIPATQVQCSDGTVAL